MNSTQAQILMNLLRDDEELYEIINNKIAYACESHPDLQDLDPSEIEHSIEIECD